MEKNQTQIRMHAGKLKFESGGREYEWGGGFGAIFESFENGISQGSTRTIGNLIFTAYLIQKQGFSKKNKVSWTLPEVTIEQIREIKAAIFL